MMPQSADGEQHDRSAKVISRIALPWSHFVRLIPAMVEEAKNSKISANEKFEDALKIFSEMEKKC